MSEADPHTRKVIALLEEIDPPIPMVVLEPGLRIAWVSRATSREFGLHHPERLVGRVWYELFPESRARQAAHEALFAGELEALDLPRVPLRVGCDEPRYFALRLRPIRVAGERIAAVLGVGADITVEVVQEQALRISENRLETALWGSKSAIWSIDVRADRAEMSPQFFALTGIDPKEWARDEHAWNRRMHPEDVGRARRVYEDYVCGRIEFYEVEYRLRTPRGWLWMHDRGRITERDAEGRALILSGTSNDCSARKSLEEALAGASTLERERLSNELHDGLAQELAGVQFMLSGIANDLRRRRLPQADDVEQVVAYVQQSVGVARAMARGLAPVSLQRGGLKGALESMVDDFKLRFGVCIELRTPIFAKCPAISSAVAEHIYWIAHEAVVNACRHARASHIDVDVRRAADALLLTVADNGAGFDPTMIDRKGLGRRIMEHRAQMIGALLSIEAKAPAPGMCVTLRYAMAPTSAVEA